MAFREAYKAEAGSVKLNEDAFAKGRTLETALRSKIDEVRGRLKEMQTIMAEDLSGNELETASREVKRELNESIPDKFRSEYEAAKDDSEAAALVSRHILAGVDDFILRKLNEVELPQNPA